jgi:hypothetical protein
MAIIASVVPAIVAGMEGPGREVRIEAGITIAAPRAETDRHRESGAISESTVSESGAAIAPIPARIVHAHTVERIIELGEIAAVRIGLVGVPVISGVVVVFIHRAVIVILGHHHVPVPLVIRFHTGESLGIRIERCNLGIAPRKQRSGQQQQDQRTDAGRYGLSSSRRVGSGWGRRGSHDVRWRRFQ